jgi:hypothetical protein
VSVFVAKITTRDLLKKHLAIEFSVGTILVPIWLHRDTRTIFMSTPDVRRYLRVSVAVSDAAEWLAIGRILRGMIVRMEDVD